MIRWKVASRYARPKRVAMDEQMRYRMWAEHDGFFVHGPVETHRTSGINGAGPMNECGRRAVWSSSHAPTRKEIRCVTFDGWAGLTRY